AVWAMWRSLCPDLPRSVLAGASAGVLLMLPQVGSQVAVIAAGAALGWVFFKVPDTAPQVATAGLSRRAGGVGRALFILLLGLLPVLARVTENPALDVFDRFYRAGSLVFGGGHVVLPLLEREVVAPGWVTHDQFLAGYGAAQAVPGPLFSLSAYLGTVMNHGPAHSTGSGLGGVAGGVWALIAIFLPALLLVAGALPFWQALRHRPAAQAAMRGANAAVVGVLLAALYHPVGTAGITDARTFGFAVAAFIMLHLARIPAWAVVGAAAALGAILL
ncbi:MAG: chromate transporter, partial [Oleiharenicola lentus]